MAVCARYAFTLLIVVDIPRCQNSFSLLIAVGVPLWPTRLYREEELALGALCLYAAVLAVFSLG